MQYRLHRNLFMDAITKLQVTPVKEAHLYLSCCFHMCGVPVISLR